MIIPGAEILLKSTCSTEHETHVVHTVEHPARNILIEAGRQPEHRIHTSYRRCVPLRDILVEPRRPESSVHRCHRLCVPIERLIEGCRSPERLPEICDATRIPSTNRSIEKSVIFEHRLHARDVCDVPGVRIPCEQSDLPAASKHSQTTILTSH